MTTHKTLTYTIVLTAPKSLDETQVRFSSDWSDTKLSDSTEIDGNIKNLNIKA